MMWLGDVFEGPSTGSSTSSADYRLPLTVVTFGLVGFTFWRETRAGTSEIQQLLELEDEIEPSSRTGPPAVVTAPGRTASAAPDRPWRLQRA